MKAFSTLVLTQGYEPLKIVSWERAVELVVLKKAEVLSEYDVEIHSAHETWKVPSVIRLKKHFRRDRKAVKFSRVNVYGRDNYTCQYCLKQFSPRTTHELTYDHVLPRSQGGKTTWTNIVSCCIKCNGRKSGRTPEQAGMKLAKKPVQPTATPITVLQVNRNNIPQAWNDYLYWYGKLDNDNED